jgi:hypothetical protein
MAKTVEFSVKTSRPFTSYLRKFASIDSTVLFEADLENSRFIAKSPNEERSIVKHGVISFEDAGFELKTKLKLRIKIGIYNISRLIKIIEQFGNEFEFIIKYDEVLGNNNQKDYAALSLLLSNNDLKFNTECTSLNIFKYISDDLYEKTIRKFNEIVSFDFSKELIEKVRSLCELDKEYKLLEFQNKDGKLFAKGKSFEYLLVQTTNVDVKIPFYKDQFDKVDVENCKVSIGADRMLFTSTDTSTEIIVSKVEVNDNYEEVVEDPFK